MSCDLMGTLTEARIHSLSEADRYCDGDGPFLEIDGRGAASWILRIQSGGERQDIGLGSAKSVRGAESLSGTSVHPEVLFVPHSRPFTR